MIYFIIGIIAGGVGTYFIIKAMAPKKEIQKDTDSAFRNPAIEVRNENIAKLKNFIARKTANDKITNNEVQELLKISDATATRYLDQLEQEGLVKQVGETGYQAYYQKL